MSNFISLLGGIFSPDETKFTNVNMGWLYPVARFLDNLLVPLIIIVLIAGAAWVIVLGVNLAKAEDTGKKASAEKENDKDTEAADDAKDPGSVNDSEGSGE